MELKDGVIVKVDGTQVKIVEKLGDRAKFNSPTSIEVRLAEVPQGESAQGDYLNKCVLWARSYYQKVDAAKKSGEKVNARQLKKDAFAELFGADTAVKPVRVNTVIVKANPAQVSKPQPVTNVALDPAELSKKFDTFKADDLPDSSDKGETDLPPLMDGEDLLLGEAHVAGEQVLQELGGSLPDISSLSDGSDIFGD